MTRAHERLVLAGLALSALAGWLLVPTYPDYDAYQHLTWGREVLRGQLPSFETFAAPTEHPLYLALTTVLALLGADADRVLVLVTMLGHAALTGASFVIGRRLFGAWAGAAGAFFVGSSFAFVLYAMRAFVDVPFLALTVWAAALELSRPRRGDAPMALLILAGLLRPDAWLLAGLYWVWCLPGRDTRRRLLLLGLALAAPVTWALVDLAVTGDPLYSLHATGRLAEALGRDRGLANVPGALIGSLADVARPPVAAAGVIGIALAAHRFGGARIVVPLALLAAGVLTFVATGTAGLSILPRYLTLPAVVLCIFAGYAVMGFATLRPGPTRARWRMAAIGMLVLAVGFAVAKAPSIQRLRGELRFIGDTHDEIAVVLGSSTVRAGLACGALTFPTYRLVPDARWRLDATTSRVRSRAENPDPGAVAVYITDDDRFERRFGRADGVSRLTNEPPSSQPTLRRGPFVVYVARRC